MLGMTPTLGQLRRPGSLFGHFMKRSTPSSNKSTGEYAKSRFKFRFSLSKTMRMKLSWAGCCASVPRVLNNLSVASIFCCEKNAELDELDGRAQSLTRRRKNEQVQRMLREHGRLRRLLTGFGGVLCAGEERKTPKIKQKGETIFFGKSRAKPLRGVKLL